MIVVGAGPAGLGVARVLRDLAIPDVVILERERVGESFRRWPQDMRFISPSFTGNAFGLPDLNAISFDSSPAFALKREHPSGAEYAAYLEQAANTFALPVTTGVDVTALEPDRRDIVVHTNAGEMRARFVIWAAGQFQYPDMGDVAGAEHGIHSSRIGRWADYPGDEAIVIGGYESGIDAAVGLAAEGRCATVIGRTPAWDRPDADPSLSLSPYSRGRLDAAVRSGRVTLIGDAEILGIERQGDAIRVLAADGRSWTSGSAPILATGYTGSTSLIEDWFDADDAGCPIVTAQDESTRLPGLFLVGPELKHRGHLFCFIYKFRQRFAVVARAIAGRLGSDTSALEVYRANNMYLDDLSCCDDDACVC